MSKTRKMLELIQVIQMKQQFSVQELADEFEVSYRTMLRYLHELSGMGIPLYAETGKHGGYRLLKNPTSATSATSASTIMGDDGVQLVIKPSFRVVGMEYSGPITSFSATEIMIGKLKQQMISRMEEIDGVKNRTVHYGLFRYERSRFIYMYAVEVLQLDRIPDGMIGATIPTRRYVTFTQRGSLNRASIDESWLYAIRWLNKRGYNPDPAAYHLEMFNTASDRCDQMEIYLPLQS